MDATITAVEVVDLRFATSQGRHGPDAMHPDPDYSATDVTLRTDRGHGVFGFGFTFIIDRGNELCVQAVESLSHLVVGRNLRDIIADVAQFWRSAYLLPDQPFSREIRAESTERYRYPGGSYSREQGSTLSLTSALAS